MTKMVLVRCNPELLDDIKERGFQWNYSQQFGKDEIDVYLEDIETSSLTEDPDKLFCAYYDINYDLVNCIEAL